ncbi:MAG: hypothetical protein HY966_00395, partial [Ignavibacteriales bacterium]|nr:hypothetical protein [Ignavibacteriales bacterium]
MTFRSKLTFLLLLFICCAASRTHAQLQKTADNYTTYYTNAGKIGLTITNFGTIGTRNASWPNQPSCEYPLGSRIEHIVQGGLWVGARPRKPYPGSPAAVVSTGFYRGSSDDIPEYTTEVGARMTQRSLLSGSHDYNDYSISHQDFIADYTDRNTRVPTTGDTIVNHYPIGVTVHQESYAWNFPFADAYAILSYTIRNVNVDTLDDVYVGLCAENTVRNTNYVRPGATGYFNYSGIGYDSLARMMYAYEANPSPGNVPADSYIGEALLGTTPFPDTVANLSSLLSNTYYNIWRYSSGLSDLIYPATDYDANNPYNSRYTRMTRSNPASTIAALRNSPGNYITMLSVGPWRSLAPGDSIQVVFAVVSANKKGNEFESKDTPEQRTDLYNNLQWAQRCYIGEDANGNNVLDPGEDIVVRRAGGLFSGSDNKLTRYVLPTPPNQPRVHVEVGNQQAAIYWDRSAEASRDPLTGKPDFEGYRVYRTAAGADFLQTQSWLTNLPLVGDFDIATDTTGYNTGLKSILIDTSATFAGKTFPGDTAKYFYQFPPPRLGATQLNGWQYLYGVSAYDQADLAHNLPSLESAMSMARIITGTLPNAIAGDVGVYPNPYYSRAYWDGNGERYRKVYFYNLPAEAMITIYTLAGDIVARLDHSSSNAGDNIDWFKQFGASVPPKF